MLNTHLMMITILPTKISEQSYEDKLFATSDNIFDHQQILFGT